MGIGIFGSGADKTYNTPSQSSDMRTAVEGSVGTLISPGAAVASPGGGALNASPGATVTQSIENVGLLGEDVNTLVSLLADQAKSQASSVSNLSASLASGMQQQAEQVADILAATKAPDSTTLTKLIPVLIALVVVWALTR